MLTSGLPALRYNWRCQQPDEIRRCDLGLWRGAEAQTCVSPPLQLRGRGSTRLVSPNIYYKYLPSCLCRMRPTRTIIFGWGLWHTGQWSICCSVSLLCFLILHYTLLIGKGKLIHEVTQVYDEVVLIITSRVIIALKNHFKLQLDCCTKKFQANNSLLSLPHFSLKLLSALFHSIFFPFTSVGRTGLPQGKSTWKLHTSRASASTGCRQLHHAATEPRGIPSCFI